MKIQCSCGAKYAFEVTPEQAQQRVQFVCPACGADSSDYVTQLARQELGLPPAAVAAPGLKLSERSAHEPPPAAAPAPKRVPRSSLRDPQQRNGRVVGRLLALGGVGLLAALGFWGWYAWFGSQPSAVFKVRFEEAAWSGASVLCGKNQIVFLHGGTLARHDTKLNQQIWSVELLDQPRLARQVAETLLAYRIAQEKFSDAHPDADPPKLPSPDKLMRLAERQAATALDLRVVGQSIWVGSPGKVVQYDWQTGRPVKNITSQGGFRGMVTRGDELLLLEERSGKQILTYLNLTSGASREEEIPSAATAATPGGAGQITLAATGGESARNTPLSGLPAGVPGQGAGQPLDPTKVGEQASHLSLAGRVALPAVLSANRAQERTLAEMNGTADQKPAVAPTATDQSFLIPDRDGFLQFSTRLIERRFLTRQATKGPPKKSALNGSVGLASGPEVSNEILNDIQRDRGGDTVVADESRYQITIRRADGKAPAPWAAEVIGPPSLFPLASVNVVTANQKLIVLDKNNQKLWESALSYNVVAAAHYGENPTRGEGPCVEHGSTLFVFDQGVLTAFDLKTGNAQWRLPSVGISSLFFDAPGMLYVNSTTASPESIKYSRQIDVAAKNSGVILKLDPRSGKTLWTRETSGALTYLSSPFLYTLESFASYDDSDDGSPFPVQSGLETQPFFRLKRLDLRTGKDLWEHFQQRAPLDVRFDRNTIRLVFRKEVQVLKFFAL